MQNMDIFAKSLETVFCDDFNPPDQYLFIQCCLSLTTTGGGVFPLWASPPTLPLFLLRTEEVEEVFWSLPPFPPASLLETGVFLILLLSSVLLSLSSRPSL